MDEMLQSDTRSWGNCKWKVTMWPNCSAEKRKGLFFFKESFCVAGCLGTFGQLLCDNSVSEWGLTHLSLVNGFILFGNHEQLGWMPAFVARWETSLLLLNPTIPLMQSSLITHMCCVKTFKKKNPLPVESHQRVKDLSDFNETNEMNETNNF